MTFAHLGNTLRSSFGNRRIVGALIALSLLLPLIVATGSSPASAALPLTAEDSWQVDGTVNVVFPIGDTVYIGGDFTGLYDGNGNTVSRNNLAAIDRFTGAPTSFAPNMNNDVYAITASPDESTLFVGGSFTKADGVNRRRVAAFDLATGTLDPFKPSFPNGSVRAVATDGTRLYIGGLFTKIGGDPSYVRLGAYDIATATLDSTWTPEANSAVKQLIADPTQVWIAGSFSKIDGVAAKGLAAVDYATGALLPTDHPSYPVLDIAVQGDQLFAAAAGPGGRGAAFDRITGEEQWNIWGNGNFQGVGVLGNFVYFGGHHERVTGGIDVGQLTRHDIVNGAIDTSWLPNVNGLKGVNDVAANGLTLYLGGDFTFVAGDPHEGFAMFVDDEQPYIADLEVTANITPGSPVVGDALNYDVTVANLGPQSASTTVMTVALSPFVNYVGNDFGCVYEATPHELICELGLIATGDDEDISIDVQAVQSGTADTLISVVSEASDPVPGNDSINASIEIGAVAGTADLNITQVDSADPVGLSSALTYTLTVDNTGPGPSADTVVVNNLPVEVTPVSAVSTIGTCALGATVTCDLGLMEFGDVATITITATTPAFPATLTNTASVSSASFDPDSSDDETSEFTTVAVDNPGDVTAPQLVSMTMLDVDQDGYVDAIDVLFDEALAACSAPCTAGWELTGIPSGGSLDTVSTSGMTATLHLNEGSGDQDTAVGSLMVELDDENTIQDAAGNHPLLLPTAPDDGASPVPTTYRKTNSGTTGLAEQGDTLSTEWSELIDPASIPATTDVIISDPASGNDQLTIAGFHLNDMDMGSDDFFECTYNLAVLYGCNPSYSCPYNLAIIDGCDTPPQAVFAGSTLEVAGGGEVVTVTLAACSSGCELLLVGPKTTVTYVATPTITDVAGNPAAGTFEKFFRLF